MTQSAVPEMAYRAESNDDGQPGRGIETAMKRVVLERIGANEESEVDELELVSTQMLKQILSSRNREEAHAVESAARTASEGVLVRHPSGSYEIIDDEEFSRLTDGRSGLPELSRPADVTSKPFYDYEENDHFSLVSSRALRRAISVKED